MSNKQFKSIDIDYYYSHLAINKSRLKEFRTNSIERNYYLNDGTEFQIELFNPFSAAIGLKIKVNGKPISNSFLVLYPAQRVWLERDFTSDNKFKFIVYEVEKNNPTVEKIIEENGKIEIEFYREIEKRNLTITSPDITWYNWQHTSPSITWDNTITCSAASADGIYDDQINKGFMNPFESNFSNDIFEPGDRATVYNCVHSLSDSINTAATASNSASYTSATYTAKPETKETGRIGKSANRSDQQFEDVNNIEFSNYYFRKEIMHLYPLSEKYLAGNDLTPRKYCTNCGKKLKQSFKYCPVCGTKIE